MAEIKIGRIVLQALGSPNDNIVQVEYADYDFTGMPVVGCTLPFHPNDKPWALKHIGEEIKFQIQELYQEPVESIHCNRGENIKVARIIGHHLIYSSQDMLEFATAYSEHIATTSPAKSPVVFLREWKLKK